MQNKILKMEKYHLHKEIAKELLFPLWLCVDKDFKSKKPADVWRMFEQFVKTSATSADLPNFFGMFKRLCPFNWNHKYEAIILSFFSAADDDEILEKLRGDDCALIILYTRELNTEFRQSIKQENESK